MSEKLVGPSDEVPFESAIIRVLLGSGMMSGFMIPLMLLDEDDEDDMLFVPAAGDEDEAVAAGEEEDVTFDDEDFFVRFAKMPDDDLEF
jgi:hypothetical protein